MSIKDFDNFFHKQFDLEDSIMNLLGNGIGIFILIIFSYFTDIWIYKFIFSETDLYTILILGIISIMSSFLLWLWIRNITEFKTDEIGILIALTKPETEERIKVNKELRMIFSSLKQLIKSEKIDGTVKIKVLPDRLCPDNEKSAHNLRDKYSADLIIWGNVNYGNINNNKHTAFLPILFSYSLRLTPDNINKFNNNLNKILNKDKWMISEGNDLFDRNNLVNNLEKISLYIISFVYCGKNTDTAIYFLKKSLKEFQHKSTNDEEYLIAKTNILYALSNIFNFKTTQLELWSSSGNIDVEIEKAKKIILELEELNLKIALHNLKAILYTVTKEYDLAKESLDQIPSQITKKDSALLFNYSYIFYTKQDVINGTQYLLKSMRCNFFKLSRQSPTLSRWYEDQLVIEPHKIYLNFPLGIIYNDLMRDKILAKDCLEKSLKYALEHKNENRVYAQIEYESEKRLKKILN